MGLDKRSFPGAIFVLVVFFICTVVIPRIDAAIDWDDPVLAGEQFALSASVAFTPAAGWNVEQGYRLDAAAGPAGRSGGVTLVSDGVTFNIVPDSFDGTPRALLRQTEKVTRATVDPTFLGEGDVATVRTSAGNVGVVQSYSSVNGDGLVAAFVIDGTGFAITAFGPPAQMTAAADEINAMIESIGRADTAGSAA